MSIDGVPNGTVSGTRFLKAGSHTVRLTANGYEDYSQTINVSSSSCSFTLNMKKKESILSPVLQNLVNNMVRVEGGTFTMGATSEQGSEANSDEKPAHQVTLSSFSIGKYEVTQEEWETVMGSNPSKFKGAKRPVECVSWDDCQDFIRKLNALTDKRFRLPTEAEWEYAARGGNRSQGYKYAGGNSIGSVAWYTDNAGSETHPVGQKQSNELFLYDMAGNVWEWCQDWYDSSYYGKSPSTNPVNNTSASRLVIRGGSWFEFARFCRVSNRSCVKHGFRGCNLGLRLAL
jgi:formylglycine-generating enzyme required for sulfatase activity